MKLREYQSLFLLNVSKLIQYAFSLEGYELTGGELLRPHEMQEIYKKDGRSKTLDSYHLKKLAIDLNLFVNGKYITSDEDCKMYYKPLAEYWKTLHPKNSSGYEWNWDFNHFEMRI